MENRHIPFRVHMAGIIEIMGTSLYSQRTTPVRELLQNAHDGIVRRRAEELQFQGRIDVTLDLGAKTLTVSDDGVGLDADEAERYLGTVGMSLTGLAKRESGASSGLIGQFGIGLLSGFLLAERIVVDSRRASGSEAVRWEADQGTDISLGQGQRVEPGTTVTLHLRPEGLEMLPDEETLCDLVRGYADFLPVPIYVGSRPQRVNRGTAAWLEPTPDLELIEAELRETFDTAPLAVLPLQIGGPSPISGALFVTSERTPGFTSRPAVTATLSRMVISRRVENLTPPWATFLRGVVELPGCRPTASREDLVRDAAFESAREAIEARVLAWFAELHAEEPARLKSLVQWHRYSLAGSALKVPALREILRDAYAFQTTDGPLSFTEILDRSAADPILELEADRVVWFHSERHQERFMSALFDGRGGPCVHTVRTFEESLLAAFVMDAQASGQRVDLRSARVSSPGFDDQVLGAKGRGPVSAEWADALGLGGAEVFIADLPGDLPAIAFLDERHDLRATFDGLRAQEEIPSGFQALIDRHLESTADARNEVLLNGRHPLVERAMAKTPRHPLASVLRLQVAAALERSGARPDAASQQTLSRDLEWIAEALAGR